ncbi:acyl carrier protein [Streptomyces iconiensis]|uniref:Acyl carrier protein n=1 Tax=Streptomyces iconiensis TaxID=1384038 RepID=A0ABT7A1C6_9ACTN|nr:acyl carrier protein [Streptomyces iconiensis]MDJ1135140.1 acyl carrier protein [Streptomyces iconiensis]
MSLDQDTLVQVQNTVALLSERPVDEVKPDHRLLEDLGLDSLKIAELAQKLQNALGKPIDDDLLNANGTTVARCAEIAQEA